MYEVGDDTDVVATTEYGERFATIVASGNLRVVAELPPASALGRVKEAKRAAS